MLRPRSEVDLAACEAIAREVHALDGYPPYMPDDDFRGFLVARDAFGAWVALLEGAVVGHVALHRRSTRAVMALAASAVGVSETQLAVVARLFVGPGARGSGVGRPLLDHARDEARARGLVPILDVWTELGSAIALYESAGWERLGTVTFEAPAGRRFDEDVYVAPPAVPPNHSVG